MMENIYVLMEQVSVLMMVSAFQQSCIYFNKDFQHGPIRAIFTVDEEQGMSGAKALDYCEPHTCDFNHELGEQK